MAIVLTNRILQPYNEQAIRSVTIMRPHPTLACGRVSGCALSYSYARSTTFTLVKGVLPEDIALLHAWRTYRPRMPVGNALVRNTGKLTDRPFRSLHHFATDPGSGFPFLAELTIITVAMAAIFDNEFSCGN